MDKAEVFTWPLLTDEQLADAEEQCFYAGYRTKKKVRVGRAICWRFR